MLAVVPSRSKANAIASNQPMLPVAYARGFCANASADDPNCQFFDSHTAMLNYYEGTYGSSSYHSPGQYYDATSLNDAVLGQFASQVRLPSTLKPLSARAHALCLPLCPPAEVPPPSALPSAPWPLAHRFKYHLSND